MTTTAQRPNGKPHSNFASPADVKAAMLAKLETSALTAKDAAKLGLTPHTAQQVATQLRDLTFARAGFKIPYFDLQGRPTKFYRFRYLEYDNGRGFAALVHSNGNGKAHKHDLRYVQPPKQRPELYLSPQLDWRKLAANAEQFVVITEGELKAACACKHQIPTVGLGGVWTWKSGPAGLHLLPEFGQFRWSCTVKADDGKGQVTKPRLVYVCFDSDALHNPNVLAAENALAHQLTQLGAAVYICRIQPPTDGSKCGLDDYIQQHGPDQFVERVLQAATPYREYEELYQLNDEVIFVNDPGLVLKLATGQRMSTRMFHEAVYANRLWHTTNTAGNQVEKQAAKEWLKWPQRPSVERLTYGPGQPRFTSANEYNLWPGFAVEAAKGDMTLWHTFMDYVFSCHSDSKDRRRWFEQWLAYPLQHPGTKLKQSVLMWSVAQGTGKSIIGYALQKIYGKNFGEIGDRHLQGNFNEWAENKQFIMGDEIASSRDKKRDNADRMKSLITQKELRLNPKYIPSYSVPDCLNYYFTSNHCDAFFMDDTDRRYFVNEIKNQPLEPAFYKEFCARYVDDGCPGAAALFDYLLHLDTSTYNPDGHAPATSSKQEMQRDALGGPTEQFAYDLRHNPAATLQANGIPITRTLFTYQELEALGNFGKTEHGSDRVQVNMLVRALRRVGFRQVCNGNPIHGAGKPVNTRAANRLWAIVPQNMAALYDKLNTAQATTIYLEEHGLKPYLAQRPRMPPWYVKPVVDKDVAAKVWKH